MHSLASRTCPRASTLALSLLLMLACALGAGCRVSAQGATAAATVTAAGEPAELAVRVAGENSLRVTLKPLSFRPDFPVNPALVDRASPQPALLLRRVDGTVRRTVGRFDVEVRPTPLTVVVKDARGRLVQELTFEADGTASFALDGSPVLGMGEGGPKPEPGRDWREQPVQFDRRGALDTMEPRWQSDMYGSRNPAPMLLGTGGWGLFVASPWVRVDLRRPDRGVFLPWNPAAAPVAVQNERNQQQALGKGLPPPSAIVPGLFDVFVFDAHDPTAALRDFSAVTGPAAMPPKWALGYMQSHRTIEDDTQLLRIIDTFREKRIPLDAVIYLGTGFCPRGWNTPQPSFDFNPDVFKREPKAVLADMHRRHVKVVVHVVPWDRDKLPTLQGTIPPAPGETVDASHIESYWRQHVGLVDAGIDAFWPDEGDWFNLFERLKRHQLYYQGPLSTRPGVRPWSLHRNGYPGIARWGGWVWSGDTESSWKTLEAQIAVGINYSLSIGPYWGSDIGGFYANRELTGELYARWHQFAAFCGSFRAHGRTWWTRLPWGWGGNDMGPREHDNANRPIPPGDRRNILQSEMNNPAIEPVVKKYSELRSQLMPYTYSLAWEARAAGMPLMRALWLHYPDDERARSTGDEYLWGRDLLVAPVFQKGATARDVYLPKGEWYDWWTNDRVEGGRTVRRPVDLATMPLYVRAGAIIPFDPVRQYAEEAVEAPTTLRVYAGADGAFTLYEDDGISQEYLRGKGSWTRIAWSDRARQITIEPAPPKGAQNRVTRRTFTILVLPDGATREVTYTGTPLAVSLAQVAQRPAAAPSPSAPETRVQFLSGHGPDDAVNWEFFCTAGRRSREWTTIAVPSCWEQQGFGTYNYGNEINADAGPVGGEQGLYRHAFTVPADWRGRRVRIVFDGSMTDTTVWVNGQQAGPMHQGAFYRFHYDITPLVKFGERNLLEATVAKTSSNRSVNNAERAADYWVFGGIFRPVWLEARPEVAIERSAIDARADGRLSIEVFLTAPAAGAYVTAQVMDAAGTPVGELLRSPAIAGDGKVGAAGPIPLPAATVRGRIDNVHAWTAETPHLYRVQLTLFSAAGQPLHAARERFGFRTIEVRERDGIYLNGTRIVLKGVNRHAFWPETGRTVSREQSYADVRMMKEANLNAVRMSHYPPDEHFLEACDELGLYVLDELGGWQKAYGTAIGARLAGELVRRDVNHPSIVLWDNGNEGGWNEKNDGEFARWDPQARAVLHPFAISGGINTDHYERYDSTVKLSAGPQIFMPTEFLHGLYDGGIGAGLRDYWDVMGRSRTVAGGFLWAWSDEGVVRRDEDGRIDTVGNQAPDGMTGPHREKEGSYFSVKEIWSPVQVTLPIDAGGELPASWDGGLSVENGYDFNSLERCRLEWQLLRFGPPSSGATRTVLAGGTIPAPPLAPRTAGKVSVKLPRNWRDADAFHVTARGPAGESLWTWSAKIGRRAGATSTGTGTVTVHDEDDGLVVTGPAGELRFDRRSGRLVSWRRGGQAAPVGGGPVARAFVRQRWTHVAAPDPAELVDLAWHRDGGDGGDVVVVARYNGILRQATWRIPSARDSVGLDYEVAYEGEIDLLGIGFDLPAEGVTSKRWLGRGPYRVYRNRRDGNVFDLHQVDYNDPVPGQSFTYPEFRGYFRDWRWLQLEAAGGILSAENVSNVPFFGLYGPRDGEPTLLAFPDTGLAFLHVIPAHGTKFDTPDQLGPQSRPPKVSGTQRGSVLLRFK